ncbi:TfoX/Sxy family protein [Sinorhizobium americanum]|uniref:Cold-shock domain family protein n=1 Tax=Sinorhizobium americanum TaxID=194963 RepID=A0A1L3LNY8_9HYPH|nr:TfoX/Sxy family protein [Sinorhizobium americanum]APG85151.1 cold-shock domain family protein [Sinorhizobium americanum CCGM7]APG91795.1 cold-shock domain family protein [Sinorhizobium americanum]OAP47502.1 cold-shock protein [Sinorhizobium americanum]TCN29875.1 TfoX-like protein [Sinorhizobium americanum]
MRDTGLEELVRQELGDRPGLSEKPMFGGLAFLVNGNLVCGAREDGMLVRLGKGNDGWALALPGIAQMVMGERRMQGWVRAAAEAYGNDALRMRLLDAALGYVLSLPPK